ncbi:ribosomal protein S2, flavodoxin-like domain-containing protein [Aspergillus pseudoustus]|uniref:Ribosomal protein S2, flavodoxin-like domain-containing protein n=1 Tax=Aspergillus pseudoustus TaxID=1810923 RepID=A0ABR4JUI3_9EURO
MIVRQLYSRQGRQLLSVNRQASILRRFQSTETQTPTTTVETAVKVETEEPVIPVPTESALDNSTSSDSIRLAATEAFSRQRQNVKNFKKLGSVVRNKYWPDALIENPPLPSQITLELLLANQTHLGHSTSRWNPSNSQYIFGIRDGIHIISLELTAAYLRRAAKVVEEVAALGGLILFVGTRQGQKHAVVRAAELTGGYHVFDRWIPGSLTNGNEILGSCDRKVVNAFDEELPEWAERLESRGSLKPDLVVCLNPLESTVLLHECGLNNVPTIGIIDTDADSTKVTYPIPANDDSLRSVSLIAGVLGRAGEAGQRRRFESAKRGVLGYRSVSLGKKDVAERPESEDAA